MVDACQVWDWLKSKSQTHNTQRTCPRLFLATNKNWQSMLLANITETTKITAMRYFNRSSFKTERLSGVTNQWKFIALTPPKIWSLRFPLHHPTLSTATEALVSLLLWLALRLRQAECMLRCTLLRSALTWDRSRSVALFISVNWRRKETTALHRFSRRECSAEKYSLKDCSCNWWTFV